MDTVRVLLADDNHGMLKILEEYFRSKGDVEVVGSVSDGAQVMAAICQHSPDVLLLDIILPRRDGFSILADMRALAPEARPKVIVLTGLSRDDFVAQAFDLGCGLLYGEAVRPGHPARANPRRGSGRFAGNRARGRRARRSPSGR